MFLRHVAGVGLAALLSACSTPSTPVATPTPVGVATTLLLWHGWSGSARQVLSQQVERFNRQRLGARVILQSVPLANFATDVRGAAAAGSGPHLMLIPNTWVGDLATESALLDLEPRLSVDQRRDLLPAALGGAQIRQSDGTQQLFGLPICFDTVALFYNRANILAPPTDTNALLASARGLSAPDAQPPIWGLALNLSLDMMIGYLYAFGGQIFDPAGQLVLASSGRSGAERWLNWVRELANDRRILARIDHSIAVDHEIKGGRALATLDWAHQLGTYRSLWGEQIGVAPLPVLAETNMAAQAPVRSDLIALNARIGAQEVEQALGFARFLIGEEAQFAFLRANMQPARALPLDERDVQMLAAQAIRRQAEQGLPMANGSERAIIEHELRVMLRQVVNGLAEPADSVTTTDRRLRERLRLS
ncbi:MAG: extracellular solute-binding protein [Roseiflexaceae bacterium]